MKKWIDKWNNYKTIIISILSTFTLFGIIWAKAIIPQIDSRIDKKLEPVVEAITYQSFLQVEQMDTAVVRRANERFIAWKKGSVVR